ncbi:DUF6328 family protein [Pendulispora albinea]|uniref:DUF6328 family protein n=1 Tax=Pendulispora albinea TaxID=2741071 RepID=A0ABZ2M1Y6_9BACT
MVAVPPFGVEYRPWGESRYHRRVSADTSDKETPQARINREMTELLSELRIALPGVQMLFAFLLTVPFHETFARLSEELHIAFFFTFACTATAAILLIAPSSNHRIAFRAHDKERLLYRSNGFAIVGIAFLALAICGVVFLISGMLLGERLAPAAAAVPLVLILATWYIVPLVRHWRHLGNEDHRGR